MKIAIASDHGGFDFKTKLLEWLIQQDIEFIDFGTDSIKSCDYPDYGVPAAKCVANKEADLGILICNNGIGMSILANKIPGIKAALVYSSTSAKATKEHHDSNVLCLGGQEFSPDELIEFVSIWLKYEFQQGRHLRRINKVEELDSQ
jgi:ribose 5-phosphate isomerase B